MAATEQALVDEGPPSVREVLLSGLPGFLREGVVPVGLFYLGLEASGLVLAIVLSTAAGVAAYVVVHRRGGAGVMARLALAFVAVQAVVGLASHSSTVYLAQPVVLNGIWGLAYFGSLAVGRPLAGAVAQAWYAVPDEVRATPTYRRVMVVESVVWGLYLLARSAIRLAVLLTGSVGSFLVVNAVTGVPFTIGLIAWSAWYAIRAFR